MIDPKKVESDVQLARLKLGALAESGELCSNALYDTLADWEHQLKHANLPFEEMSP